MGVGIGAICLIDTSIFVEILDVPAKAAHHKEIIMELEEKIRGNEKLFLPMATILETGNHIAQNGDGAKRRRCAEAFVSLVRKALNGEAPFNPIRFLDEDQLALWLDEFPDSALRGNGLGDLSIIKDFNTMCLQNRRRGVYIWSLDRHLSLCIQESRI